MARGTGTAAPVPQDVWGWGFRVLGFGFSLGFWVLAFWVFGFSGFGFRVSGLGFRV